MAPLTSQDEIIAVTALKQLTEAEKLCNPNDVLLFQWDFSHYFTLQTLAEERLWDGFRHYFLRCGETAVIEAVICALEKEQCSQEAIGIPTGGCSW